MSDIPAFQTEDYMPPENEMKSRVDFIYSEDTVETEPDRYWKKLGNKRNDQLESFIGKRKAMEQAAAEIVAPGDSPEVKLQKIYAPAGRSRLVGTLALAHGNQVRRSDQAHRRSACRLLVTF